MSVYPNQWAAMHSLVHCAWQTQHQLSPQAALVHTMCMHPPLLSVGARHPGHGLVVRRMATALGSRAEVPWRRWRRQRLDLHGICTSERKKGFQKFPVVAQ